MEEEMIIDDIYAGKLDANDDIMERGYDEFASSYIKPSGINIERLASTSYGTPFFIMGDKGTGKTALLRFLEKHVQAATDNQAFSSFISFEKEYLPTKRTKLDDISRAISTSIAIDKNIATTDREIECDFTYIWRWQLYQKIIDDNSTLNNSFKKQLFLNDEYWKKFAKEISKIGKTVDVGRMRIPPRIEISATPNPHLGTVTSAICVEPVDLTKSDFNKSIGYSKFVDIICNADIYVQQLTRTDIPYYVFIDELEAYRGENDSFYRDLRMIRDLLFTVKRLNDVFKNGTKLICSVRIEIINSIDRFIQSNQLNKIMLGYDERLFWEYTNTNSFKHPIMRVLIKKIELAEARISERPALTDDIIKTWFAARVFNTHICTFILDHTWHKPRDIVRLILAAQSKNSKNFSVFDQNTFETFMREYSGKCLAEVIEEMKALYSAAEIESIINCLHGYKMIFSFEEMKTRSHKLYPDSKMAKDTVRVLNDIYRIGMIGNYLNNKIPTVWAHRGQYKLLIDEPWKMIVHPALRLELTVSGKRDKFIYNELLRETSQTPQNGDKILTCVECDNAFIFEDGERRFYAERGFNTPVRCKPCRDKRKGAQGAPREFVTAKCASCGGDATIPFKPALGRPVFCSDCFAKMKSFSK